MQKLINTEKLSVEVQNKIIPFFNQLLTIHNEDIVSAAIYGSATGINYNPKSSNINCVLIVKTWSFALLEKSLKEVSLGLKQNIAPPLILTKEYIASSCDVFPIEFLDIKENHILLYGEDVFTTLEINKSYIRLFCEQQIKGKLITISQAYLEVGLDRGKLRTLLQKSLNALIPIFRNLIRLKGQHPSIEKQKIIEDLSREFQLDSNRLIEIYQAAIQEHKCGDQKVVEHFQGFLNELKKLSIAIDQL